MDHDSAALTQALATRQPPAIAAALHTGTVLVPSGVAPEGDERVVVSVDDQERRILYGFSTAGAFAAWVGMTGDNGDHRVLGGRGLGALAQQLGVDGVILDPLTLHAMSLPPRPCPPPWRCSATTRRRPSAGSSGAASSDTTDRTHPRRRAPWTTTSQQPCPPAIPLPSPRPCAGLTSSCR